MDLLKSKVKFVWSSKCAVAFENVKALLCSSPLLAAPCFDRPLFLQVDASQVGAGAVLQQSDTAGVIPPVRLVFFYLCFYGNSPLTNVNIRLWKNCVHGS